MPGASNVHSGIRLGDEAAIGEEYIKAFDAFATIPVRPSAPSAATTPDIIPGQLGAWIIQQQAEGLRHVMERLDGIEALLIEMSEPWWRRLARWVKAKINRLQARRS
jgi:hypothetical protein